MNPVPAMNGKRHCKPPRLVIRRYDLLRAGSSIRNLWPQPLHEIALLWSNLAGRVAAWTRLSEAEGFPRRKACSPPDAGDIGLSKGPPMQSKPTLKDTDPHDVFAIETLLAAHAEKTPHAEKAPPLAHDPATAPAAPQIHVAPPISLGAPTPQVEPTFPAPDARDVQIENVRPSEIKVDGLKLPGERPTAKWVKRVIMALLGLCGATAAAAWQHYGDQATAMATEWAPPFVLAALPSATRPATAEQPSAPAAEAATTDQAAAQPA